MTSIDSQDTIASQIAVLEVKESDETMNEMTNSETLSSRSSLSTIDSNQDHVAPLELGLVISALQTSLVEQDCEQEQQHHQMQLSDITELQKPHINKSRFSTNIKPNKRENAVIIDYELDHGVDRVKGEEISCSANAIVLDIVDKKTVKPNMLTPREQEKEDEVILKAINHLFNNRFMKAKTLFEKNAKTDPLHALGLGSMVFLKAITTNSQKATKDALKVLMSTYSLATAQIDNSTKSNIGGTVFQYLSSYYNSIRISRGTGIPTDVNPVKPKALEMHKVNTIPNGVLRAHVVRAETCLQMAILYLLQENVAGYIKCGLNLKRAYASYNIVWQEYKRMGQLHNEYIDGDTISGVQFGIGTVHLVLSSLPKKILRIVSAFGWKADKHLGFALLKLCLENRRARSTMSSLMLLAYYTTLTSICPQVLSSEYTQPAIETLLDAQKMYPNSTIFLYFAGRTSRLAKNLSLSNQSFIYAIETSRNEWAEVELFHMCSYEIGFNYMMQNNWEEASSVFDKLCNEKYWSTVILRYLTGACLDMMGHRTEAILTFAEIPKLMKESQGSSSKTQDIEKYILRKIQLFQSSGYQDMDMTMCALEYLYLFNAYGFMDFVQLEQNLALTDYALSKILDAEKLEYGIRTKELLPETPPPQYYDQRGALLLIKASILNSMERYYESIIHLNWIIDHKDKFLTDKWIVPYAYWEVGMTSWNLNQKSRGRMFWEKALSYTNFDFEFRLAMRVNLAITRADEMGIEKIENFNSVPKINNQQQYNRRYSYNNSSDIDEDREDNTIEDQNSINSDTLEPTKTESIKVEEDLESSEEEVEQIVDQLRLSSPVVITEE